jgi:hypothetical protein
VETIGDRGRTGAEVLRQFTFLDEARDNEVRRAALALSAEVKGVPAASRTLHADQCAEDVESQQLVHAGAPKKTQIKFSNVIPVETGIQDVQRHLVPRFRGEDTYSVFP